MAHFYKRKNKRIPDTWYVCWYEHGKKKKKWAGHSKAVAQNLKREIEGRLEYQRAGLRLPTKEILCRDAIDKYLEYSEGNKAARTFQLDKRVLARLLLGFLEKRNIPVIVGIYPEVLEDFKTERLTKVSKSAHNRELTSVKAFFNMMVQWNYLRENPAQSLKKLQLAVQLPRFLTNREIECLLKAADERTHPIIETFLYTGLRRSELQFLRWQDVDLQNKRVIVQNREGWHTKNYRPRTIPMHSRLLEILGELSKRKETSQYVFPSPSGNTNQNLSKDIRKVVRKAGLEDVSILIFRHSFASHLAMAAVPIRTIQSLMGHADIRTTMIYAHLSPEHLQGAVEKLEF